VPSDDSQRRAKTPPQLDLLRNIHLPLLPKLVPEPAQGVHGGQYSVRPCSFVPHDAEWPSQTLRAVSAMIEMESVMGISGKDLGGAA
ncbi:hypothetical protein C0991_001446, partial [Blastosporella zonata]